MSTPVPSEPVIGGMPVSFWERWFSLGNSRPDDERIRCLYVNMNLPFTHTWHITSTHDYHMKGIEESDRGTGK